MDEIERRLEQFRLAEALTSMTPVVVVTIALVGVALAVFPLTWQVVGYPVTIVHELGHALAALVSGYRLHGITVNGDMSGATAFSGVGSFRTLWALWWGYPAPAVLGGGLIWAVANGWAQVALALLVAGLFLTFVFSRSWHTVFVVLVTGVVLGLIGWYATADIQNAVVFGFAWLLLVGAVRALYSVTRTHVTRDGVEGSDAYMMGKQAVVIPGPIWLLTFAAAIGASAWFGGRIVLDAIAV